MRTLKDIFLIRADKNANSTISYGKLKLFFDPTWGNGKYEHAVQIGTVVAVPERVDERYFNKVKIKQGDTVLLHHFVVQDENILEIDGEDLYKTELQHIWGILRDDEIIPTESWLFVEPILEPEENLWSKTGLQIKLTRDPIKQQGIVAFISGRCAEIGILPGTHIHFAKDADYPIKVNDKQYYRMNINNLVAVIDGEEIEPLYNQILVEPTEKEEVSPSGLILINHKPKVQAEGTIVKIGRTLPGEHNPFHNCKEGDKVLYFNGYNTKITNGVKEYALLTENQAIGILEN